MKRWPCLIGLPVLCCSMGIQRAGRVAIRLASLLFIALVAFPTAPWANQFTVDVANLPRVQDTVPVQAFNQGELFEAFGRADGSAKGSVVGFAPQTNSLTGFAPGPIGFNTISEVNDIRLVGPATPTGSIFATLHVPLHGTFVVHRQVWGGDFDFHSNATLDAHFMAQLFGTRGDLQVNIDPFGGTRDFRPTIPTVSGGIEIAQTFDEHPLFLTRPPAFFGIEGEEVFGITGQMDLPGFYPVNVPIPLFLSMSASISPTAFFAAGASGLFDALHTFGVPQDGSPVFDLPPGYTAFSETLGIVDNAVPVAAAPEPATATLLTLGIAMVAFRRTEEWFARLRRGGPARRSTPGSTSLPA